jgi:hypothetical protein
MDTHLIKHFFDHPDWKHVEDLIMTYANQLIVMEDVDVTKPAGDVKAEVIGRLKAYDIFCKFVSESKIVGRPIKKQTNPFQ